MQMHDRAARRTLLVHREMQKRFLRRRIAVDQLAVAVEPRNFRGIEPAEARVGRRQKPSTIRELDADISRAAVREATVVERFAKLGYLFA